MLWKKCQLLTMHNRNYGGFDYVRIKHELLKPVLNSNATN